MPHFFTLKNVQNPKEKSGAKKFFAKVIRAGAKVYLCEENLGVSCTSSQSKI